MKTEINHLKTINQNTEIKHLGTMNTEINHLDTLSVNNVSIGHINTIKDDPEPEPRQFIVFDPNMLNKPLEGDERYTKEQMDIFIKKMKDDWDW